MVADVQDWLDNPAANFGWIVMGNEGTVETAKRFDSKENTTAGNRPSLTITYTPPTTATPTPSPTPGPPTPTPSGPTLTPTPTATPTPTPTLTPTPSPTPTATPIPFSNPLFAPPVLTSPNINVSIEEACVQILPGPCTNMWTYGGTYPGATIRRPTGQTTRVTFTNNLPAAAGEMTVHNHGNHSSPENDGRPAEN